MRHLQHVIATLLLTIVAISPAAGQQLSSGASRSGGQSQANQASGGAANADFDSLIDLIQSSVAFDSWMENGTGDGEIQPFPTGVYADASGALRFAAGATAPGRVPKNPPKDVAASDVRQTSSLRYISLPRLEAAIGARQAQHQPLPIEMLTLAGLQRIEYVMISPESGDLLLAGPAGDWRVTDGGHLVSVETEQPVVRLDDLLTLWRLAQATRAAPFGCSIIPRQKALAATQQFLQASSARPLEPSQRRTWLAQLRNTLGKQDVEFFGIEPDSHAARVLLVADYHMKLIGMGLAEGVEGVTNYLDTVELAADGSLPPMSVLRWWFAMNYQPVETNADRDVYHLVGQGVQVLSENELLAARGRRVHTGQSDELNRRFANSFTEAFDRICLRYPLYGELRNVFDLALIVSLIEREGLADRVDWQPRELAQSELLRLPRMSIPREIETVINHRVIRRKQIIAGVSGGVWVDSQASLKVEVADRVGALVRPQTPKPGETAERWWWD